MVSVVIGSHSVGRQKSGNQICNLDLLIHEIFDLNHKTITHPENIIYIYKEITVSRFVEFLLHNKVVSTLVMILYVQD